MSFITIKNGASGKPELSVTDYTETVHSVTGTSLDIDTNNGTIQKLTTTGASTVTLPSSVAGKSFTVLITFGGAHAITWAGGSTIKWADGTAPTVSESGTDAFTFFQDGTNTYGVVFGQGF